MRSRFFFLILLGTMLSACAGGAPTPSTGSSGAEAVDNILFTVMPMYWEGEAAPSPDDGIGPQLVSSLRDIDVGDGEVAILARRTCHDGVVRAWGTKCVAFTVGSTAYVSLSRRVVVAERRQQASRGAE